MKELDGTTREKEGIRERKEENKRTGKGKRKKRKDNGSKREKKK